MLRLNTLLFALLVSLTQFIFNHSANAAGVPAMDAIEVVSVMDKQALDQLYTYPYTIGEKDPDFPLWPLYKQDVTGLVHEGYVYESIEYSSIPGFMGIPFNLLVAIDKQGTFIDVKVLFQREPMFVGGVGEEPMRDFIAQYPQLSLMQDIKFSNTKGQKKNNVGNTVYLDGITGATASLRILNQTLLSSALKVARAKLGFGTAKSPDLIAKIDTQLFSKQSWSDLRNEGLIHRTQLDRTEYNLQHDEKLSNSSVQQDNEKYPVDLYVANLAIPSVGKNLLSQMAWEFLQENLGPGDQAFLVISHGQFSFMHNDTLRGGISDKLLLRQEGLPLEMRDIDFLDRIEGEAIDLLRLPTELRQADWMIYRVIDTTGIDIALPLSFELEIDLNPTTSYRAPNIITHSFNYELPSAYYYEPDPNEKTWHAIWRNKTFDLAILALALVVLALALRSNSPLSRNATLLTYFRTGFLLFTLFFVGWHAQGQLSIVNITGAIQSLLTGGDLSFFLYDPMTTSLWAVIIFTFVLWGRGTFCGWLCPFGALQELIAKGFKRAGVKQRRLTPLWDSRLKWLKYAWLGAIIVAAFSSATWTDRLVEVEPFKTSITLYFIRDWPYVLWALLTLAVSALFYKGFCRYLCPLGAAMAILGRLRINNWIDRRSECGNPCQLCTRSCLYGAISTDGKVHYEECFQCLDCVAIYESETRCVPRIIEVRNGRSLKAKTLIDITEVK